MNKHLVIYIACSWAYLAASDSKPSLPPLFITVTNRLLQGSEPATPSALTKELEDAFAMRDGDEPSSDGLGELSQRLGTVAVTPSATPFSPAIRTKRFHIKQRSRSNCATPLTPMNQASPSIDRTSSLHLTQLAAASFAKRPRTGTPLPNREELAELQAKKSRR